MFFVAKNRIIFFILILLCLGGFIFLVYRAYHAHQKPVIKEAVPSGPSRVDNEDVFFAPPYHYNPPPLSMKTMKLKGCVADGLLSGYGEDTDAEVAMINRSECLYLHRALETWASPPDFAQALDVMQKITKPNVMYGMFLAEDIRRDVKYFYPDENRYFDFSDMCRDGSQNAWGEHTCKPNIGSKEYRKYLSFVTHKAMDIGIQSFLFGQIYFQDNPDLGQSKVQEVLDDMRSYAKRKGIQIAIGAQTGNNTNENYLRKFDYIEGGVGIGDNGVIENGACWSQLSSCWALLWNDQYALRANNVIVALDWSGLKFDDMSSFARMDAAKRKATLNQLYNYFTAKRVGFLMPLMATLNVDNGGCHGPKKRFYSASNDYNCRDENVINNLLKNGK